MPMTKEQLIELILNEQKLLEAAMANVIEQVKAKIADKIISGGENSAYLLEDKQSVVRKLQQDKAQIEMTLKELITTLKNTENPIYKSKVERAGYTLLDSGLYSKFWHEPQFRFRVLKINLLVAFCLGMPFSLLASFVCYMIIPFGAASLVGGAGALFAIRMGALLLPIVAAMTAAAAVGVITESIDQSTFFKKQSGRAFITSEIKKLDQIVKDYCDNYKGEKFEPVPL